MQITLYICDHCKKEVPIPHLSFDFSHDYHGWVTKTKNGFMHFWKPDRRVYHFCNEMHFASFLRAQKTMHQLTSTENKELGVKEEVTNSPDLTAVVTEYLRKRAIEDANNKKDVTEVPVDNIPF